MAPDDVSAVADELYALEPDGFVQARDARAKELRAAGQRDTAAAVKKLRRPTVVAWAVNRLARERPDDLAKLFEQTAAVAAAQEEALGGAGGDRLRAAGRERREALARLVSAAVEYLEARAPGSGAARREDVMATLEAAAADPEAAAVVRRGHLDRELDAPSGFGGLLLLAPTDPEPPSVPGSRTTGDAGSARAGSGRKAPGGDRGGGAAGGAGTIQQTPDGTEEAERRARQAAAEAEAEAEADAAVARAREAADAERDAMQALDAAEARVGALEDELAGVEARLAEAREHADRAADAVRAAERAAADAQRAADAAVDRLARSTR